MASHHFFTQPPSTHHSKNFKVSLQYKPNFASFEQYFIGFDFLEFSWMLGDFQLSKLFD
jgi:hypothetical protein